MLGIADFILADYNEASSHLRDSATQFESLDAPLGACHALVDLGLSLRLEGKLPDCAECVQEGFALPAGLSVHN